MPQPTDDSVSDRLQAFCQRVYREIKRKLYSGRTEDARIEIQVNLMKTLKDIRAIIINSHMKFFLSEVLDCYIGTKWNEQIMNLNDDFADYVVPETLRFWLTERNPIVEFKLIGDK